VVFVKLRQGETLEEALKRFKRDCERNGILKEIKQREFYAPPSVKKQRKLKESRKRKGSSRRRGY
jgi:small subunit ribosomal protein S21